MSWLSKAISRLHKQQARAVDRFAGTKLGQKLESSGHKMGGFNPAYSAMKATQNAITYENDPRFKKGLRSNAQAAREMHTRNKADFAGLHRGKEGDLVNQIDRAKTMAASSDPAVRQQGLDMQHKIGVQTQKSSTGEVAAFATAGYLSGSSAAGTGGTGSYEVPPTDSWATSFGNTVSNAGSNLSVSDTLAAGSAIYSAYSSNQQAADAKKAAAAADPWRAQRSGFAAQLSALSADPSGITKLPGYDENLLQGEQAIQRASASRGELGSGQDTIALQNFGQNFSGGVLQGEQSRLSNLAGGGFGPTSFQGQTAYSQALQQALASIGGGFSYLTKGA